MKRESTLLFLLLVLVLIFACLLVTSPPHTDPGVEILEPGVARVHNGETLILWVPSGKSSVKYSFHFEDDKVTVEGFIFHDERVILDGCETFRIALFHEVKACRDGENMIFRWNEFFLGVRIDQ